MKPPVSYYGGKQRLAYKLIPLIPKHTVYCEPFCGGAALMFKKPWPDVTNNHHYREIVNDLDGDLINFYRQLRDSGPALVENLQLTLYSEEEHKLAKLLGEGDDLERARRYYINISQSFSNVVGRGWGRNTFGRNSATVWANKIAELPEYLDRMSSVYVSNTDALKCINQFDAPQSFFYCDPPYPGTDQGPYSGYTEQDFTALIEKLDSIEGSFMLSCYYLENVKIPDNWERFNFNATCSGVNSSARDRTNNKRTEVVYRKISDVPVRKEIQELYDSGRFDCFKGEKSQPTRAELLEMF